MRDFFNLLLACCQPYRQTACLTLTAIHPDGQHPTPSRHIPLDDLDAFNQAAKKLLSVNDTGWGAYFAVGLRKGGLSRWRRGGAGDIVALPALFVDLDNHSPEALTQLRAFSLTPSCIVDSGGGFHAYWWLDTPTTTLDRAGYMLRELSAHFGGDTLSVAQSLRLPQTTNTKPKRGGLCRVVELSDHRYALADFGALLPVDDWQSPKRQKPYRTVQTVHALHDNPILNSALIEAVMDCLCQAYGGYRKDNGYIASRCPCGHQQDAPGKHFNFDAIRGVGVCFGRHGRLLLRDLCSLLHVDPATYGGFYQRKA